MTVAEDSWDMSQTLKTLAGGPFPEALEGVSTRYRKLPFKFRRTFAERHLVYPWRVLALRTLHKALLAVRHDQRLSYYQLDKLSYPHDLLEDFRTGLDSASKVELEFSEAVRQEARAVSHEFKRLHDMLPSHDAYHKVRYWVEAMKDEREKDFRPRPPEPV
jgi:hypothetical protein